MEIFCVKLFNGRKRWTWFDEASICVKRTLKWVDWQQNANSTANENKQKFSEKSRRLRRKTNFWICCSIRLWFWENGAENVCGGRELIAFAGPLHIPSHSSQKFKKIFLLSIIVGNNVFSWKILLVFFNQLQHYNIFWLIVTSIHFQIRIEAMKWKWKCTRVENLEEFLLFLRRQTNYTLLPRQKALPLFVRTLRLI